MAISLLGYVAPQNASALTPATPKAQTSTPAVQPYGTTYAGSGASTGKVAVPLGVNATSPYSNQSAPSTTLPASQTAKPTTPSLNTSSFTPQQQALFSQAAALGTGVQTQNGVVGGNSATPPTQSSPFSLTPAQQQAAQTPAQIAANTGQNQAPQVDASDYNMAQAPSNFQGFTGLLGQLAANPSSAVQKASQNVAETETNLANSLGGIGTEPIPLEFQQGRQAVVANTGAQELSAQQGLLQNALTEQGQQISAANSGASLTQPVIQAGMLTNPLNGQPLNPSLVSNAIQQATQLVQNGTPVTDPQVQALLNPFGYYGASAFTQAEQALTGGTYNPAQQAGAAQQNVAQAVGAQGQGFGLSLAMDQLSTLQPVVTSFLQSSGLNAQGNPYASQALNTYSQNFLSPANYAILQQQMGDIKKYTSQILAANTGTIPTDIANTLSTFDPSTLSVSQLIPYMQSLQELGGNQLSNIQAAATASGSPSNADSGTPTAVNTSPPVAPNIPAPPGSTNNLLGQEAIGAAIDTWGGISGFFTKIFDAI